MYDSEFICTYKMMDTAEEQEQLYKIQFLQAFCLEEWNDEKINSTMVELYDLMKLNENLANILSSLSKVESLQEVINMAYGCIDRNYAHAREAADAKEAAHAREAATEYDKKLVLFGLLFQFDYFDLFHRCIYDFIHLWYITDKSMKVLIATYF
jgi:hypothetical protein